MTDHTRLSPVDTAFRNDELVMVDAIQEGDCARGFVVFQTAQGERPAFVLFQSTEETLRWEAGGLTT
jgi:hypothetical protein